MSDKIALDDCREEVKMFALAMEAKLRENDHKGGWKSEHATWLMSRLEQESRELREALNGVWDGDEFYRGEQTHYGKGWVGFDPDRKEILKEAADIANFAMMVADVCGAFTSPEVL